VTALDERPVAADLAASTLEAYSGEPMVEVTGPGLYPAMPFEQYLARPELSSSELKDLLPPSCPYLFKWNKATPQAPKPEFDFGSVAHKLVLGQGHEIEVLQFDSFRTAEARDARDEAYAEGKVPVLARDYANAKAMAWQVQNHPIARDLLSDGQPEVSAFWEDPRTKVGLRCRFDWLREVRSSRQIFIDYKTIAGSLDTDSVERAIYNFGYHQRMSHYRDGGIVLGLGDEDSVIVLIFQMKTAPYLVRVVQFTPEMIRLGRARNRRALDTYLECTASGYWPGYDDVTHVELPGWAEAKDQLEYL